MRVFFAAPFTQFLNQENVLSADARIMVSDTVLGLEQEGHSVFSAHVREQYGEALMEPQELTVLDLQEMEACDFVMAIPGPPASGGVHIELGWASILRKPAVIFLLKGVSYSPIVHGLCAIADVTCVEVSSLSAEVIVPVGLEAAQRIGKSTNQGPKYVAV